MNNKHPTFPNPIIHEAICEIHFRLPDGVDWKTSLLGELYKHIQTDFPELEPVAQVGIQLQIGAGEVGQAVLPSQQRMRYRHASRNLLLQLSENILSVNVLPRYPGWAQMLQDILDAWGQVREVINPAIITQIGLRYINRILKAHSDETAGDWLAPSTYIPESVLSSLSGFLSRLEVRTAPQNRLIVTLGDKTRSSIGLDLSAIVLDIDCIVEKEIGIGDDALVNEATALHDVAWQTFAASITPRLENLLQDGE